MQGIDLAAAEAVVRAAGGARVTIAGGVTTAAEVAALDRLGADAQVGMALYTGRLALADAIAAPLTSDRTDGLWPTVVCDERGIALGLAWSSATSLARALETGHGVYHSRRRGLWLKGETSGATQELLRVDLDCDRDALRFVVRQHGPGFCHQGTRELLGRGRGAGAAGADAGRAARRCAAGLVHAAAVRRPGAAARQAGRGGGRAGRRRGGRGDRRRGGRPALLRVGRAGPRGGAAGRRRARAGPPRAGRDAPAGGRQAGGGTAPRGVRHSRGGSMTPLLETPRAGPASGAAPRSRRRRHAGGRRGDRRRGARRRAARAARARAPLRRAGRRARAGARSGPSCAARSTRCRASSGPYWSGPRSGSTTSPRRSARRWRRSRSPCPAGAPATAWRRSSAPAATRRAGASRCRRRC